MLLDKGAQDDLGEENLAAALQAIQKDWAFLAARLRRVEHDVVTDHSRLNLRLHYPALRDSQATVEELVEALLSLLPHFSLPRKQIQRIYDSHASQKDEFSYHRALDQLGREAKSLFIRARKAANRNGEAGELLLYLLTEWVLEAPQIIAKLSLKTSGQMPVHGSDGVHARFDAPTGRLMLYSGEAKLYADLAGAVQSAVISIKGSLSYDKLQHEIGLVQRNIDFSGLPEVAKGELLKFLDPFDEASNERVDVVTCLIGFDFAGYADVAGVDVEGAPQTRFEALAVDELRKIAPRIAAALTEAGLPSQRV